DNNMVPLGGATVTIEYSDPAKSVSKAASPNSKSTKTKSDGSYEITGIPINSVVTVTITSADTIQSTETITATAGVVNSSAILKGKGKKIGLIKRNQDSILNTFDDTTMPQCQITIPANAVNSDVDQVYLTSTHQGENLPALPDGYVFLAGADFSAPNPVTFATNKEATPYIILPPSVRAEDLSTADIRLMEFINGNWVITTPSGKGKVNTTGQYLDFIGPDLVTPAKLKGVRPWAWAISQTAVATINGTIKNAAGNPLQAVFVFGGGTKTHSKSDGTYTLKNIAVIKPNTLIPLNVMAEGYQPAFQFVNLSPGSVITAVNFTLVAASELGEVYGRVTTGSDPIWGAIVTLQTAPSIRGMKYDNKNTATDLTDDTFFVIPPSGVNISNYKWMLIFPNGTKFTSANENGSSVVLNQLATEAGINSTGAYRVELEVTYSGGKKSIVSGGFLLNQSGLVLYIADVKLPVSLQDQLLLKAMTNESGDYRFINMPLGETFNGSARAEGFIPSNPVQIPALTPSDNKKQQNFSLLSLSTDTEPPTAPGSFTGTARSTFSILLTWSASTDNIGIAFYRVYRGLVAVPGLVEIGKTTNTFYLDSGLTADTNYKYQVGAVDKANWGTNSDVINISTPADVPDNTAPSTPTNLAATVIGPTQINLSWWASSDNVGVAGYKVYRNSELRTTVTTNSHSDTGLSASTQYEYKVAAYDNAGNTSDFSNVVSATTAAAADTQAPTVPTGPAAIAVSSGQINFSWTASTDNIGVTGYKVYRSTNGTTYALRATLGYVTTSYSDGGLSASTQYWYKVAAYDAAGNTSAQSSATTATTQSAGGGNQLVAHWKFDETSGTTANDSSGNGNNGTVYGPAWSGSALSFDGVDDYVYVGKSDIPPPWTAEFWVKRENSTFVSASLLSSSSYAIKLEQAFGTKKVGITRYSFADYVFNYEAPISSWVHLVFVCTPSDTKLFVNGNLQDTLPTSIYCPMGGIGREEGFSYSCYYKGLLDDVKIYNYARTAEDIQAEYNYGRGWIQFDYTGSQQTWIVPAGVTSIQVDVRGAQGTFNGGNGARVQTTLSVTPGETLYIYIGGRSVNYIGGYNGGGSTGGGLGGGGGGGASDIRQQGTTPTRIVIAGGGGGYGFGGAVGGAGGQNGTAGDNGTGGVGGGGGGTQSAGGSGGNGGGSGSSGADGSLHIGGTGGHGSAGAGGGGGGGYYGGGGGGGTSSGTNGGGGGGSSYSAGTGTTYTTGYQSGNGQIIITY
ncbi:MAG: fibronectin type III domain-containing protein, partial [Planctomycetota bacterium]|nr:fibronectin type III domain-containing protein [Planctomycetota bacterium]